MSSVQRKDEEMAELKRIREEKAAASSARVAAAIAEKEARIQKVKGHHQYNSYKTPSKILWVGQRST